MKPLNILLVEDNDGDILLTTEALEETKIDFKISVVKDGRAAIDFMVAAGEHTEGVLIDLVLLDINLPKKNGHEVLKFIKEHGQLKHIPVVMLTTSSSQKDRDLAYSNAVNYIIKPPDPRQLLAMVKSI